MKFAIGSLDFNIPDITPPAGITNLQNIRYGQNFINWTWTDPVDADFSRVIIYLNGSFAANVTGGVQFYNATGLNPDTSYTISTRTVDTSGNVNRTWINHTARTASPPIEVTIKITPNSINLKNKKTVKVTVFNNTPPGFDVAALNISSVRFGPQGAGVVNSETPSGKIILYFNVEDTGIRCGDTGATLTGKTYSGLDIVGSDSIATVACDV